jgi:hypothetical protein
MFDVGRPLADVALVPLLPVSAAGAPGAALGGDARGPGPGSGDLRALGGWAGGSPRQAVLLRWGGLLSVLDLEQGSEVALAAEVEAFWLSDAITFRTDGDAPGVTLLTSPPPLASGSAVGEVGAAAPAPSEAAAATLDVEMPWWLYGPGGMQLVFPSSLASPSLAATLPLSHCDAGDIELEFDQVGKGQSRPRRGAGPAWVARPLMWGRQRPRLSGFSDAACAPPAPPTPPVPHTSS